MSESFEAKFRMNLVPAGTFNFRGSRGRTGKDIPAETGGFQIGSYLVTNEDFWLFVEGFKYEPIPRHWRDGDYPKGKARHPVVNISRTDAMAYCRWLSNLTGRDYRLPTEEEWEKAARGLIGQTHPWTSQEFDADISNFAGVDTTLVDEYTDGVSPFGCYDIVGNVSEWTCTDEGDRAVVRGSSYVNSREESDCYFRVTHDPKDVADHIGFRVAMSPKKFSDNERKSLTK